MKFHLFWSKVFEWLFNNISNSSLNAHYKISTTLNALHVDLTTILSDKSPFSWKSDWIQENYNNVVCPHQGLNPLFEDWHCGLHWQQSTRFYLISGKVEFMFKMKVQMGTQNPMCCGVSLEIFPAYIAGITLFSKLYPWFRISN